MSTLLVDIGNSRVKWARLAQGVLAEQHAAAHAGWSTEDWRANLFGAEPATRVLASTVAGGASAAALREAARRATGREAEFVATRREAAGVRNGYAEARLLGVDRWLAVIGAYRRLRGACVVADAGTAMTIDVVAADGQHGGGFIVPGPALMVSSLLDGTSDLVAHRSSSPRGTAAGFADNTRDAIERGCRVALAALVDRCVVDATNATGAQPTLLLTGGAADELRPHLRTPAEHVPDLVLRGLAALVEAGAI